MKNPDLKYFFSLVLLFISVAAIAQQDTNSVKAFKDIHKTEETDRHLEKEIKKKELQKAPSLLYLDSTKSQVIKQEKYRRKKKTNH
jgi:predicted tellurium resistance membrane protein TerC